VGATYYRFFFHAHSTFPVGEFWSTLFMIVGGMVRSADDGMNRF
jgi:hypothetical protein